MPEPAQSSPSLLSKPVVILVITLVILAGWGIVARTLHARELQLKTAEEAILTVTVIHAPHGPESEELVLPGTVSAWHESPIYARTNGYLKDWKTDIGSHVKAGQLLAEIDTPDVDAQLQQAIADLATAEANNRLAQITAKRWTDLLKTDSVSKQEADEKIADAEAKATTEASARANRDRLQQLEDFKRVVAPFAGVITARTTDTGDLITAGQGKPLFTLAESDKLRIYVQVPENDLDLIHPGITAELHFNEHPGKIFKAVLENTADGIDPTVRTLLVQFVYTNRHNELLPGGYTEVHIKGPTRASNVRLPVNTLLFRAQGLQVATIDAHNRVQLKSITIARDFGKEVEINTGIEPGEPIILNPSDSLVNGQEVKVAAP